MKKAIRISAFALAILIVLLSVWFLILRPVVGKNIAVISTDNYKINGAMMSYLIKGEMEDYVSEHTELYGADYIKTIGLSADKSLKWQKSPYGESWFSYFYDRVITDMKTTLATCEAAKEAGIVLTDEEEAALKKSAEAYEKYGTENVLYAMKTKALAEKFKEKFYASLSYGSDEYEKYYNGHREEFDYVDYKYMEISVKLDGTEEGKTAAYNAAKSAAQRLVNRIASVGFDKAATDYLSSISSDKTLADYTVSEYAFEERTQFGAWAFNKERKDGDSVIFEGTGQFSVYYLEKAPYKLDYKTRKVQMVTMPLGSDPYATVEKMQTVYSKWQEMENTEANFKTLSGAVSTTVFKETASEKLRAWVYSDKRAVGDWDVVEDTINLYLVRYTGEGDSSFTQKANEALGKSDYDATVAKAEKNCGLKVKKGVKTLIK